MIHEFLDKSGDHLKFELSEINDNLWIDIFTKKSNGYEWYTHISVSNLIKDRYNGFSNDFKDYIQKIMTYFPFI